jgi:hypothetical protein
MEANRSVPFQERCAMGNPHARLPAPPRIGRASSPLSTRTAAARGTQGSAPLTRTSPRVGMRTGSAPASDSAHRPTSSPPIDTHASLRNVQHMHAYLARRAAAQARLSTARPAGKLTINSHARRGYPSYASSAHRTRTSPRIRRGPPQHRPNAAAPAATPCHQSTRTRPRFALREAHHIARACDAHRLSIHRMPPPTGRHTSRQALLRRGFPATRLLTSHA